MSGTCGKRRALGRARPGDSFSDYYVAADSPSLATGERSRSPVASPVRSRGTADWLAERFFPRDSDEPPARCLRSQCAGTPGTRSRPGSHRKQHHPREPGSTRTVRAPRVSRNPRQEHSHRCAAELAGVASQTNSTEWCRYHLGSGFHVVLSLRHSDRPRFRHGR